MNNAMLIDTILFIISSVIFIFWIWKKHLNMRGKLVSILLFMSFNSAYNIMIKKIHDYNMAIPRTFIWNYNLVGPFSIYDILFIFLFIVLLPKMMKMYLNKNDSLFKLIYLKELLILFISVFAFVIFKGYWLDGGNTFLINIKGLIYFNVALVLTYYYLNYHMKLSSYLFPIALILINGYLSLQFFPINELWVRYGQTVKIISQEGAYTISLFIITYLGIYLFNYTKNKTVRYFCVGLLFLFFLMQNVLSIYKANFIYFAFIILVLFLIRQKLSRVSLISFLVTIMMIFVAINSNFFYELATSKSIQTRSGQLTDYLSYIGNSEQQRYLIGSGLGSPYKSEFSNDDMGEIKLIDLESTVGVGYRFAIQTPIISVFKDAGFIGLAIYIIFNIVMAVYLWRNVISTNLNRLLYSERVEILTISILIIFLSWKGYVMIGGTTPLFIFSGFLVGRFIILFKKLYRSNEESRGIMIK